MKVDTFVVDETYRERLNGFIQKQVENGGQCYVVCPAIEEKIDGANEYSFYLSEEKSKSQNIKNVLNYADNLRQTFPNLQIEVLHGKLKSKEKDEIMARFSSGEAKILVSTTVIEVGVNVPNASLMIIENADRYGLSQLHQLRGRVGRGTRKSYCVLVSNLNTEKAKARLNVMKETNDGFEIANKDLELRGPGDFFKFRDSDSYRQSGGFNFKLATLTDDVSIMDSAFSRAKSIVSKDPDLSSEENSLLKAELEKIIAPITSTIS